MRIINDKPCIYLKTKHCGKKFELFYVEENLLLTKKSGFEKLVSEQMNEWKIEKKYHTLIIHSLEVLMPMMVLMLFGFIIGFKK